MHLLDETEKTRIRELIQSVEKQTSGEIVTVIAADSDEYLFIPTLWAALISLLIPGVVMLTNVWIEYSLVYLVQVLSFFVLASVFRIPAIKMRLVPGRVKKQRASRVAREQFFLQHLHNTKDRTGVLIFVSVAEHYVEIIADKGINDVVPQDAWQNILADFVTQIKQGRHAQGFIDCITQCGEILHKNFPVQGDNPDELCNHLVEI